MTPKKDILRSPTYAMPDGKKITAYSLGLGLTLKETAFILWYTHPGTEAFLNAGRAAVRAGYNPNNAVMQGYLLKRKPHIDKKINELLFPVKEELRGALWRIIFICKDRMFFDITDFYRSCKRTVKIRGVEHEVDSIEAIPLNEISEKNRMCIDAVNIKTINGRDEVWYKLPDRDKAMDLFMKCYKLLVQKEDDEELNWKATAEIIRENAA